MIPKIETDYFFDLEDSHLSKILTIAKPIAIAIQKSVPCKRIGMMVAGLEVPHAHLHLVPITATGQLNFAFAKPADQKELEETATLIRKNL